MYGERHAESDFSPEAKETNPRQAQIDQAFELVTLSRHSERFFEEDRDRDVPSATQELLAEPLREQLGEPYQLSLEGSFTLARRERYGTSWDFDPRESLAVVWDEELDLPAGQLSIEYSVFAKAKESDGWDRRYYTEPILENQRVTATASPEAVKKVIDRLEAEFVEKTRTYETKVAAYEQFSGWVKEHSFEKFDYDEWNRHDFLKALGDLADTWRAEIDRSGQAIAVYTYNANGNIRDVLEYGRPVPPKRSWPEPKTA